MPRRHGLTPMHGSPAKPPSQPPTSACAGRTSTSPRRSPNPPTFRHQPQELSPRRHVEGRASSRHQRLPARGLLGEASARSESVDAPAADPLLCRQRVPRCSRADGSEQALVFLRRTTTEALSCAHRTAHVPRATSLPEWRHSAAMKASSEGSVSRNSHIT